MSTDSVDRHRRDADPGRTSRDAAAKDLLVPAEAASTPVLSIVIPTMNEEKAIGDCLARCREAISDLGEPCEIIVSDSSTDRTPEIARRMGAIVVTPDREGYGYAYRYAFRHVRGRYVAIGDADTTYDFAELPALLAPVVAGDADVVLGNRLAGEIESGAMPALHRYVGNPLLTWLLNRLHGVGVGDAHSGFRVVSRDALGALDLSTDGMEFASEMLVEAERRGLVVEEVPITYRQRTGDATLDTFGDGWRHVRFMLLNAPGHLFSLPALCLVVGGLAVMLVSYVDLSVAAVDPGVRSMLAGSLMVIVGYQVSHFGTYAVLAGDATWAPTDPITAWLVDHLSLERGLALGGALALVGGVYVLVTLAQWAQSGFDWLPFLMDDVVAFTAIVLGVQTIFSSFLMSAIANGGASRD